MNTGLLSSTINNNQDEDEKEENVDERRVKEGEIGKIMGIQGVKWQTIYTFYLAWSDLA